jgi:hypothetical protein
MSSIKLPCQHMASAVTSMMEFNFPAHALVEACLKRQNRGYSIISPAEKSIGDELAAAEF